MRRLCSPQRLQALVQRERNFLGNLRRKLTQLRQPLDSFGANLFRQPQQERGRLTGVQVRQDEGDGLRMLHFEELGQLLRIGFLQAFQVDGILFHRIRDLLQQPFGAHIAEGFYQQFLSIFRAAFGHVILRKSELVILFQHRDRRLRFEVLQLRNAPRQALHVVLGKIAVDVAGRVLAEQHHQNRRFLQARIGDG